MLTAGAAIQAIWLGNLHFDFAIKIIPWNVQLGWAHFRHGAIETTACIFSHALWIIDMTLVLGEFLKHRQLIRFLKTTKAHAHRACFGGNHHNWGMRPICGSNCSHAVADSRSILGNDHTMPTADTSVTVSHVCGPLLMHYGNQTNTCWSKNIHCVHKSRTHNSKDIGDAIGSHCFDKGL